MNWLRRMLVGRYGTDQLSLALIVLYFVLFLLSYIPYCWFLSWIGLLVFAVILFRTFSKNIAKRYHENQVFLRYWNPVKNWFKNLRAAFLDRKTHRYYRCPNCKQRLRVPKGRGKIKITCPKCHNQFIKKT
jgi:hypothetical protein